MIMIPVISFSVEAAYVSRHEGAGAPCCSWWSYVVQLSGRGAGEEMASGPSSKINRKENEAYCAVDIRGYQDSRRFPAVSHARSHKKTKGGA